MVEHCYRAEEFREDYYQLCLMAEMYRNETRRPWTQSTIEEFLDWAKERVEKQQELEEAE